MEPDRKAVSSTENPLRELLKGTLRSWLLKAVKAVVGSSVCRALSG